MRRGGKVDRRRPVQLRALDAPRDNGPARLRRRDRYLRLLVGRRREALRGGEAEVVAHYRPGVEAAWLVGLGEGLRHAKVVDERPRDHVLPPAVGMNAVGDVRLHGLEVLLRLLELRGDRHEPAHLLVAQPADRLAVDAQALLGVPRREVRVLGRVGERRRHQHDLRAALLVLAHLAPQVLGVRLRSLREVVDDRIVVVYHVVHAEHDRDDRRLPLKALAVRLGGQLPPLGRVDHGDRVAGMEVVEDVLHRLPVEPDVGDGVA